MEQLSLYFEEEEAYELKNIVKISYLAVKKRLPHPIQGESDDEYKELIRDETLLEISERLKNIALRRQRMSIDILYKGINYENNRKKRG